MGPLFCVMDDSAVGNPGSVYLAGFGVRRLLGKRFPGQAGSFFSIQVTGGNPFEYGGHNRRGLAVLCKLGLERLVDGLVYGIDFLFPPATVGCGIVDGLEAGTGNGDVAFGVGAVVLHAVWLNLGRLM